MTTADLAGDRLGHLLGPDVDPRLRALLTTALAEPALRHVEPVSVLRHVPGRRLTLAARTPLAPCVLKVFASPRARGNRRRLLALAEAGLGDLVPAGHATSADGHVGLLGWTPGDLLEGIGHARFVGGLYAAGVALRRLHESGAALDRAWTWAEEAAALVRRAPAVTAAAAARAAAWPVVDADLVPSHRDLHPRQVVCSVGAVRLIDLDDAAMAPAGLDVGNMLAHLRREAVLGRRPAIVADVACEAFLEGYGRVPDDLDAWVGAALARLAGLAESRHRDPEQRDALLAPAVAMPAPPVRTVATGHADRPVRIEPHDDGPVAVKAYLRGGGDRVFEEMTRLWESPLGASRRPPGIPEPLAWDGVRRELRMSLLPGAAVASRGGLGRSLELAEQSAALVAELHACGVSLDRRRAPERLLRSAARKAWDRAEGPCAAQFARVLAALSETLPAAEESPLVPTHGDLSPRNVMAGPEGLRLLDLDRLQMAPAGRDVAYWRAWLWATDALSADPHADSWALGEPFLAAYERASGRSRETLALPWHEALALVRIAHGWSALQQDPAAQRTVLTQASARLATLGGRGSAEGRADP